jgi:hypothetical protein
METPEMRQFRAVERHRKIDYVIIPNMVGRSYLASCEIDSIARMKTDLFEVYHA